MKTDIGIIAFDLDGTLLTEDKILTPRTEAVLQKAADMGIILLPTTGRSLDGIPDAVKLLPGADYAITANGAGVYKRTDAVKPGYELLFSQTIDRATGLRLMSELSELDIMPDPFIDGRCYMIESKAHLVDRMDVTDAMKDYIRSSRTLISDMGSFLSDKDMQKITINFAFDSSNHRIDLDRVLNILEKYPELTAVTGGIKNIEVTDASATKGDAMLKLADMLHIAPSRIVAFGDSENDITMLKNAGIGVAMANSLDITKDAADELTLCNEEDGVAVFLEDLLC